MMYTHLCAVSSTYPEIDLKWRFENVLNFKYRLPFPYIQAKFTPHDKLLKQPNALGELEEVKSCGRVSFEVRGRNFEDFTHLKVDGAEYSLDATGDPKEKLFLIFADGTTKKTTYGGLTVRS